jgi:hypothetical protein
VLQVDTVRSVRDDEVTSVLYAPLRFGSKTRIFSRCVPNKVVVDQLKQDKFIFEQAEVHAAIEL